MTTSLTPNMTMVQKVINILGLIISFLRIIKNNYIKVGKKFKLINFKQFESIAHNSNLFNLMESISIWKDLLLASINAIVINVKDILGSDKYPTDLDKLSKNSKFISDLKRKKLRLSNVENTDDYETLMKNPCKFAFIYNEKSSDLDNPLYIIFQQFNVATNTWDECRFYKVNENINKFYNKLTNKTIEIIHNGVNYIYNTDNGSDWLLLNRDENEHKIFKNILRREELEEVVNGNKEQFKIKVI